MLEKVETEMPRDTAAEHDGPPQRKRHRMPALGLILVLVGAVSLAVTGIMSRNHDETKLAQWTGAQAIPTVKVVAPARGTTNQELILPGDVEAFYEAPIYARVPGYLKLWYKDIGARVKAGDTLAVIDTPDLDQRLEQAKSNLASVRPTPRSPSVTAARWKALLPSNSVSRQSADEKVADARAKEAQVAAAKANVDRLQAPENFKYIVAPFDGVVTARDTDIGALINAGSGSGSGSELFKVADIHQMRVYVRVPQAYASQLHPGLVAYLKLAQYPHEEFKATLDTTSNAISEESRTVLVELTANNKDGKLWPGRSPKCISSCRRIPTSTRSPPARWYSARRPAGRDRRRERQGAAQIDHAWARSGHGDRRCSPASPRVTG